MNCQCTGPGKCPVLGRYMSKRNQEICSLNAEGLTTAQCEVYRQKWHADAATQEHSDVAGCTHRGEIIDHRTCNTCGSRGELMPIYRCDIHGECSLKPISIGAPIQDCWSCVARTGYVPEPLRSGRIATHTLPPSDSHHFNNSIMVYRGRYYMAYRHNFSNSRIVLLELGPNFDVKDYWELRLPHGVAQEDPRLWVYKDQLHVSYSAYINLGTTVRTDVCYARLGVGGAGWHVEDGWSPQYARRNHWEKNWSFFEHKGELLAVYSIKPHRIIRLEGERTELIAETKCDYEGKTGALHGGAPAIYHRGEFYHWYHRRMGTTADKTYTTDLYTFEAEYPFRPARHIANPLLVPRVADRPHSRVPYVVFPGGAFITSRHEWCISYGYYDKWSEWITWDINRIEACLTPLPGGPYAGLAYRPGTNDLAMYKEVHQWNEYRVPQLEPGSVVVDIGAHIGSFTLTALDHGAAYVVAAEPHAPTYAILAKNIAGRNVDAHRVAVGGHAGTLELRNRDTSGTSTVGVSGHVVGGRIMETVPMVTYNELTAGLGRVRVLKIDCEGAEYEILEAANLDNVQEIVGEAHEARWRGKRATIHQIIAILEPRGFVVTYRDNANATWDFRAVRP